MGFDLSSIFGGTAKGLIDGVTNLADKFITSSDEKKAFLVETEKLAQEKLKEASDATQTELDSILKDVQSARNREIQVNSSESSSWLSKNVLGILALAVTVGFFGMLGYMCKYTIPIANERILDIMLGSLGSAWIGVVSYYFGSSQGSAKSGDALRKIAMS